MEEEVAPEEPQEDPAEVAAMVEEAAQLVSQLKTMRNPSKK